MNLKTCCFAVSFVISIAALAPAQMLTYEGKDIILDAPANGGKRASRYTNDYYVTVTPTNVPPANFDIYRCDNNQRIPLDFGELKVILDQAHGRKWCFKSPSPDFTVSWREFISPTQYGFSTGPLKWIAKEFATGFYSVRDFGVVGNGIADDTAKIRNAITFVGAQGGGTLYFGKGIFKVTDVLTLPSGIFVQGASGRSTSTYVDPADASSSSQIYLDAPNKAIFRIGESSESIRIKNIELRGNPALTNTYGIDAVGNEGSLTTTQMISFESVVFTTFDKGIYVHNGAPGNLGWHFDYVKIDHCLFTYNRNAGINIDTFNTDWKITNSFFAMPVMSNKIKADAIFIEKGGAVLIDSTYAGGDSYANKGGTFIAIDKIGALTVINSASERASNSILFAMGAGEGALSTVLNINNSVFGDPIRLQGRVNFISNGNFYLGKTVNTTEGVMIYSTGDRFCYDPTGTFDPAAPCGRVNPDDPNSDPIPPEEAGFQGNGRIMFQSGQIQNGIVPTIPMKIGNDVEINGDVKISGKITGDPVDENDPILKVTVPNVPGQGKALLEMGQSPFLYRFSRDRTNGYLKLEGTQSSPFKGYILDGPIRLAQKNLADIYAEGLAGKGTLIYCLDCVPNTTPCQIGGTGALAVSAKSQWDCK